MKHGHTGALYHLRENIIITQLFVDVMRFFPFAQVFISQSHTRQDRLNLFGMLLFKTRSQKITEEVMIAQPLPICANGQNKQVILYNCTDQTFPILPLRIQGSQNRLTKRRIELFQHGCSQQEITKAGG